MKKQSLKAIVKSVVLSSMMSAALFVTANAGTSASTEASNNKVEVKYAGYENNEITFNVKFSNPEGGSFSLLVLDENGESLFRGNYADKKFEKKFKLLKSDLPKNELSKLTFVIQSGKETYRERFEVNIKAREVEDVVVSRG